MDYNQPVTLEKLEQVKVALAQSNFVVHIVDSADAAKQVVKELIPAGAEVMTMTSVTLDQTGIADMINETGDYKAVRPMLYGGKGEHLTEREKKELANVPEFSIGSVHAVTEQGQLVIASNTGSQMAAHVYGADKVIFVVGAQKIVDTLDTALKRIYDYVLPLEDARAQEAYGRGSNVSKILIINKEVRPERIHVILMTESIGF